MTALFYAALALLFGYAILFSFYLSGWRQLLHSYEPSRDLDELRLSVTVIIAARNEEANIAACLSSIIAQDYPASHLEIIVVNDQSTDNTVAIIEQQFASRVKILHLPAERLASPKKRAISMAIAVASGQLIVTTDADCTAGRSWISTIVRHQRASDDALVAGPVRMVHTGTMVEKFQSLDFLTMQGITASSMFMGFHHMGNGANLAYTREAFHAVNGFEGNAQLASGDDMFLVQKVAAMGSNNYGFLPDARAIVETKAESTWSAFLQQRIRWASKATHYRERRMIVVLLLVYVLNVVVAANMFMAFTSLYAAGLFMVIWVLKFLIEYRFVRVVAGFYQQHAVLPYLFSLQPLHILYIVVSGFFGQIKTYTWKGRKLK